MNNAFAVIREWADDSMAEKRAAGRAQIYIGLGTCGIAAGGKAILKAAQETIAKHNFQADIVPVGCIGICFKEPLLDVARPGSPRLSYGPVTPDDTQTILENIFLRNQHQHPLALATIADEPYDSVPAWKSLPFFSPQERIVLRNCGFIDPRSIKDYIARDGYAALARVLAEVTPAQVIDEVKRAGLRGRGGAGFPAAVKWEIAAKNIVAAKAGRASSAGDFGYLICNADEGDPGAFMNRSVLEGDPHSVLEGMAIAAYAIGAGHGYIYCRAEYPLAIEQLEIALNQAREKNLLGDHILGSDFSFDITLKEGAGAFVCGEETALMASIEGRRGMPQPRPPFPAQSGLWGKPTIINNVETLNNVPMVMLRGAESWSARGTAKSKGTKTFALTGKVQNSSLIEIPLGLTLRQVIYEIGGGILGDKKFKAAQTGGPSGGCLATQHLDMPIDYDSLAAAGSIMGSGGLVVMDEHTCMVDVARYFLNFTQSESCGKCVPCRLGTKRMLEILERITAGQGEPEDITRLEELAQWIRSASLCALGQSAPNPVLTTLKYFRQEYEAHIYEKRCPAGSCQKLVRANCVSACPAGVDTPAYVALVAQGRYAEALAVHREANPFAMICGRVCPAFCEKRCRRAQLDEPIAIRNVKRFMADRFFAVPWTPPKLEAEKEYKVAVIGAGPCGLTAALRLAQRGYQVTVFEKMPQPGGMMTYGIPAYRLPREPLFAEIDNIRGAGVDIRCNMELGKDMTIDSLRADGYQAIIVTVGAHKSRDLGVPGENKNGVYHAVQMLRDIALGSAPDLKGKRVIVVGGGDTAMDAARSSLRLGARSVQVVYRRTQNAMPAIEEDIEATMAEGIQFHFLVNPVAVLGDQQVAGVRLQRQRLGDYDNSGRRRPVPIPGDEFEMECDVLVPAIGQVTAVNDANLDLKSKSSFDVGKAFDLNSPGVFAAGDAVLGPATVVNAVAHGNAVAKAVDHWLSTSKLERVWQTASRHDVPQYFNLTEYADARRPHVENISPEQRAAGFDEVELVLDETQAQAEARRCLRCDLEWLQRVGEPAPEPQMQKTGA